MNRTHFVIPYKGNKREETKHISKEFNLNDVDYIVEPFCGSSAVSYALSKLYPNRFTYILNDNSKYLIRLYNILKEEHTTNYFKVCLDIVMRNMNKEKYKNMADDVYRFYIHRKVYEMHAGLYPVKKKNIYI
jgi:site-specific DNA-adenine methylase